jgi:hypothetical protein
MKSRKRRMETGVSENYDEKTKTFLGLPSFFSEASKALLFAVVFGYFSRRRHHEAIGQKIGAKTFHHRGFPGDSSA